MERNDLLIILKEENYPVHMLDKTIAKLECLQPVVANMLSEWINTGKIPPQTISGYSFSTLTNDYGMKPIGAFLTLDWLAREPERAIASLKRGIK